MCARACAAHECVSAPVCECVLCTLMLRQEQLNGVFRLTPWLPPLLAPSFRESAYNSSRCGRAAEREGGSGRIIKITRGGRIRQAICPSFTRRMGPARPPAIHTHSAGPVIQTESVRRGSRVAGHCTPHHHTRRHQQRQQGSSEAMKRSNEDYLLVGGYLHEGHHLRVVLRHVFTNARGARWV